MRRSRRKRGEAGQAPPEHAPRDWTGLEVGVDVEVQLPNRPAYLGEIDAKSPDSKIVWVISKDGSGRKMYGDWEGVSVYRLDRPRLSVYR
ncbi:hypothetical protein [Arthrobacter sp. NyZ413]|uniref:hypothetical protein n=1 Tax=Arthrobacter sp. NyZ413 TaxID=3144669 RepID=UPI003BF889F0